MKRSRAPRRENEPARHNAKCIAILRRNNRVRGERTDDHHHRQDCDNERQLVADHLRDRPHRAQHRKLVVTAPAGHEHGELRCRSNGKEKEDPAINRKRRHAPAIRNDAEGENCGGSDQDWREKMHNLVGPHRDDVFLDQHLDAVGDWLKEAERPDPIRAVAILYSPEDFPFQHRHERKEREKHGEERENVNQARRDLDKPVGRTRQP